MRDATLDELCAVLFATLRRADQRGRGAEYLRGLLAAPGRKSIRNIAAATGGAEQGLHHFVCDSTWDWAPVRRALAEFVVARAEPRAWVLRPMVIPKAGTRSVGVGRRFDPVLGQTLNAQQAVGVWAAAEWTSSPVSWRLRLSPAWLADERRRVNAAIPAGAAPETIGDCAVEAFREVAGVADRPVVLDAREMDAPAVIRGLAGQPLLVRVPDTLRLSAAGPVLPGHDAVPAGWLMGAVRDLRRPVTWTDGDGVPRTALAAVAPVVLAEVGPLRLVGIADIGAAWPAQLWLTTMSGASPATLSRLARLTERVDRDLAEIAEQVGIRDFSGRSFVGWHRHVTLASAAHAVIAVSGRYRTRLAS
ncbi:IS701 family transposase [Actinophytocola sp.]|uniref:IS701 family transposase n=1 Tax=Actinophytocola sp. TaxID=1872138 RepID=UPI00389A8BA0